MDPNKQQFDNYAIDLENMSFDLRHRIEEAEDTAGLKKLQLSKLKRVEKLVSTAAEELNTVVESMRDL